MQLAGRFESGRQDLNLRPPGPQPEGSGCTRADSASGAGSSCSELPSVALNLDPGLDPATLARTAPRGWSATVVDRLSLCIDETKHGSAPCMRKGHSRSWIAGCSVAGSLRSPGSAISKRKSAAHIRERPGQPSELDHLAQPRVRHGRNGRINPDGATGGAVARRRKRKHHLPPQRLSSQGARTRQPRGRARHQAVGLA